jgi:hypothetical protein
MSKGVLVLVAYCFSGDVEEVKGSEANETKMT